MNIDAKIVNEVTENRGETKRKGMEKGITLMDIESIVLNEVR